MSAGMLAFVAGVREGLGLATENTESTERIVLVHGDLAYGGSQIVYGCC
jgi:hypothetical protein